MTLRDDYNHMYARVHSAIQVLLETWPMTHSDPGRPAFIEAIKGWLAVCRQYREWGIEE